MTFYVKCRIILLETLTDWLVGLSIHQKGKNMIRKYIIYVTWTTTLYFERVCDSNLFATDCGCGHILVEESDLEKLKVNDEFSIPVADGVEWTRKGLQKVTGMFRFKDCYIGSIEKI